MGFFYPVAAFTFSEPAFPKLRGSIKKKSGAPLIVVRVVIGQIQHEKQEQSCLPAADTIARAQ